MKRLAAFVLLLICSVSYAAEEAYEFDNEQQRALFLSLTEELRCPMCQNQNIADSDAMIAHDLRRKTYQLIQKGYSREEIVDYMKQRYGDFVSYSPPVNPATVWLWLLPVLFVCVAVLVIVTQRRSRPTEIDESRLAEAEKLLEKDE